MSVVLLILGLVLFVGLVIVHELGHFLVARRNGVDVEEFGIGFPPRAWSRKTKKGFVFSINWLPIGGFVKLKGENDAAKGKGTFGAAPTWSKTKIMLAGVVMNLVVAFGLFTVLAWVGLPQLVDNQFSVASDTKVIHREVLAGYVEAHSPASRAGIVVRDKLLAIGTKGHVQQIGKATKLPGLTAQYAGKTVQVQYEHKGVSKTVQVQLHSKQQVEASRRTDHPIGYMGVSPTEYTLTRATWSAPVVAGGLIGQFTAATLKGLGVAVAAVFQGEGSRAAAQVAGPVGVFAILKDGSLLGYQFILMIVAIISLTLAIMNVLPIPALDGGRFYMVLLSRIFKKKMSQEMEERIVAASFVFLMFLIILITVIDVKRFF